MPKRQRPESLKKAELIQEEEPRKRQKIQQQKEDDHVQADEIKTQKNKDKNNDEKQEKSLLSVLKPKITNFTKYDASKQKQLPRQFYRQQVVELSKALLGKVFIRKTEEGLIKAIIVETQAYKAPLDKGCHAYNNKKTEKTKYFWLDGGSLYIYTIYMPTNICLNVVAGLQGQPQAVLIRAVQPIEGIQIMKKHRNIKSSKIQDLCNGPGKVGQSLLINKDQMNGIDLMTGDFKIVDAGLSGFSMGTSRRVNIDYAEQWIYKPWRFYVQGNTYVSKVVFKAPEVKKKKK